jgi:hypothetical protein
MHEAIGHPTAAAAANSRKPLNFQRAISSQKEEFAVSSWNTFRPEMGLVPKRLIAVAWLERACDVVSAYNSFLL